MNTTISYKKPVLGKKRVCVLGIALYLFAPAVIAAQLIADTQQTADTQPSHQVSSGTFWLPSTIQLSQNSSDDLLLDEEEDEALSSDELLLDESDGGDLLTDEDSLLDDGGQDDLLTESDDLLLDDGSEDSGEGDLLSDEDSLLDGESLADEAESTDEVAEAAEEETLSAAEQHEALFAESRYPSANTCAACHPKQYREWSVSQHAYAQLSPVYMAMQITINSLTSATNGDFCIRCHNQVGMNMGESIYASNLDRHPTSREGITCVVCHRVNKNYGKVSGRLALEEGDLYTAIYGPSGGGELNRVLDSPGEYQVSTDRDQPGRAIHATAEQFFALTEPAFCGSCHDVTLLNGFRLEEAFTEFKQTKAAAAGISCQDCHMGVTQGLAEGYEMGPAAEVGGVPTASRRLTNHFFAGPDYSIIHPGLFPHSVEATALATQREWLKFDYEAGWGTDEFEDSVADDHEFPEPWQWVDARYDARAILDEQFERLEWAREKRLEVLKHGFELSDIRVRSADASGISFEIDVINPMDGHGVPTGFDAERLIFLDVTVTDPVGNVVYRSGDRDPNGDVRDSHSLYVHNGELPLDKDLFNLQTKFIVRPVRGAEREQVLAVNTSSAALPFIRPETRATTIYGRPRGARKHKQTIEPNGSRTAQYRVNGQGVSVPGEYSIDIKLVSQMIPVNLIDAIKGVGFDYSMSPKQIADRVVDGALVVWEKTTTVMVDSQTADEAKIATAD